MGTDDSESPPLAVLSARGFETDRDELTEPVQSGDYHVRPGDCFASIAEATGHLAETLWNLPQNQAVHNKRQELYVLHPQDAVTVPPLRRKQVRCATDKRHRFRRKGVPERLRIRLFQEEWPRDNEPFALLFDTKDLIEGTTNENAEIEEWIPVGARWVYLVLHDIAYKLTLGGLAPVDSRQGAIDRLFNLGFLLAPDADEETYRFALVAFQESRDLPPTGALDRPTQEALEKFYTQWEPGEEP